MGYLHLNTSGIDLASYGDRMELICEDGTEVRFVVTTSATATWPFPASFISELRNAAYRAEHHNISRVPSCWNAGIINV